MKKLTIIFLLLLAGALPLSSQEMQGGESHGFFDRLRFSCEWGYLQSLYTDWHYNILSEEGYRINERSYGLDPHPNGLLLIGAGFVPPGDLMMISLHGGYSGIHEGNRIIPALLRFSFFPKTVSADGIFCYAQAGAGFHIPKTFKTRVSTIAGLGAGYRFAFTRRCSLDLMLNVSGARSKPPIPNPDGPGYVDEKNIRSNSAGYLEVGLTISVNI